MRRGAGDDLRERRLELKGGSGRSEFLTVYGGLELGLALVFLLPAVLNRYTREAVLACLIIRRARLLQQSWLDAERSEAALQAHEYAMEQQVAVGR